MIYNVEGSDVESDTVCVEETEKGNGVFARRAYAKSELVGRITGNVYECGDDTSEYTFEFEENLVLDPDPPFRFLNHSCDANCEFELWEEAEYDAEGQPVKSIYLFACRDIEAGEELTIEYNWAAEHAIPCLCGSANCVGWIVCEEELDKVDRRQEQDDVGAADGQSLGSSV